jgi:hypothetical protein
MSKCPIEVHYKFFNFHNHILFVTTFLTATANLYCSKRTTYFCQNDILLKKCMFLCFFRHELPVPMFSRNDFSIWSVLRNCIGKELSKITMPVIFNEPLSFLQRMVEYMEYAHLLRRAAEEADPIYRMQVSAVFHANTQK